MGRERPDGGLSAELAKHPGIEIHGSSIRIVFMWKRQRCRETLGLPVTKANIKHAAQLRAAVLHDIKLGTFDYGRHFPESRQASNLSSTRDQRLSALLARYKPLKAVDITAETESRYIVALDICVGLLGPDKLAGVLIPEDIQTLRVELIRDRAASTTNHYLATLSGFLSWCEANQYCREGLAAACTRFSTKDREPDPLSKDEFKQLLDSCQTEEDKAAITVAVYTGLRPGELCALAAEDVHLDTGRLEITRSITSSSTFKVPKTGKPRTILLLPPAVPALKTLLAAAKDRETLEVEVWSTRHEFHRESVTPLIAPTALARKRGAGSWLIPTTWHTRWSGIQERAGIRARRPYQTRHTYACWCLAARGNLAFISKQMGHTDFTMLVKVYAAWMDDESPAELERIWQGMNPERNAPNLPQEIAGNVSSN